MIDGTVKPDPELLARIADEIVEALRKAYVSDQKADKAYDATWRKYKAPGVGWETFLAARELARPRLSCPPAVPTSMDETDYPAAPPARGRLHQGLHRAA